ncbi:MAG TPA: DUF6311 domain-containing protein [Candidatus Limnocylindria bacterium]|nr:DUF6311 domain-containing protein [Candidatus Limnocylindria bacterium]
MRPTPVQEGLPPVVAGLVGLLWFVRGHSLAALDPTNVGWVLHGGDTATHLFGWLFFRREPWQLPLGAYSGYLHPVGSAVALTDSMPWLAFVLKPFSPWLPAAFQYVGPWIALSFVLQGVLGALLMRRFTADPWCRALGGVLIASSPVLLWRTAHETLCAQWLLLAMLALYLSAPVDRGGARRRVALALVLVMFSAGIQPYLAVMVCGLALALVVRLIAWDRLLDVGPGAAVIAASVALPAAFFWAVGIVGQGVTRGAQGFGQYSADLLTFVNPMQRSSFLPGLPQRAGQYEGFAYLGAGVLALLALVIVIAACRRRPPAFALGRFVPLMAAVSVMAVYALSAEVTVGGRMVMDLRALYAPITPFADAFRASGRFVWPLYYLLVLAIVVAVVRSLPRGAAIAALALASLVQVADLTAAIEPVPTPPAPEVGMWSLAEAEYRHLVLYPPQILWVGACLTQGQYPHQYYVAHAWRAYRLGLTVNSGYMSRANDQASAQYCQALTRRVTAGEFSPDTVYVVAAHALASFTRAGMTCGRIDASDVCVTSDRATPLSRYLASPTPPARP